MRASMTIDSSWLAAFKEDVPHAFTPAPPFRPRAVFVDGQIKLMQSQPSQPQTWDEFIHRQFARHLTRFYERCDTVILAFDNYAHVPRAKAMTQAKRQRPIPPCPFDEHAELPCTVPEGELWARCIASRAFKARVIDLVLLRLPHLLLAARPGKRLVVDYTRPVQYVMEDGQIRREELEGLECLGEADVKFPRHADMHASLLVDSIDGDSVAIALRHHELCLRRGLTPPRVCVYRMEIKPPAARPPAPPDGPLKRREGAVAGGPLGQPDTPVAEPPAKRPRQARTYEYVHVHALYEGLMQAVAQSLGRVRLPAHQGHEMAMLLCLVGLTGTDFSRKLPQLSGAALFSYLPDLWGTLAAVFDPAADCLRVEPAADRLVALIYRTKYANHVRAHAGIEGVLQDLRASKISARTKETLPSAGRVLCTLRNTNWLLAYWTCAAPPDPFQPCYGFRTGGSGRPEFAED